MFSSSTESGKECRSDFPDGLLALGASAETEDFLMIRPDATTLADAHGPFGVGAKRSWVPIIGEIVWEIPKEDEKKAYYAYICKVSDDRQIGYVRVPDYNYSRDAVDVFDKLVARFQRTTAALVIDQVNNPGGSMSHMYKLLSTLTDRPLALPQHQITITDDDAAVAADVVANAEEEPPERVAYSRLVLSEREAGRGTGRRLTRPLYLGGVEQILPAKNHYTRKIVVLINELIFSAGEFLAAILQDNRRATLFGARTAGAGGCAKKIIPPGSEQFGIAYMTFTWTIARRTNGEIIEDIGVQPDVAYEVTVEDLQSVDPLRVDGQNISGFQGYRRDLLQTLTTAMSGDAAGGLNGSEPSEARDGDSAGADSSKRPGSWRPSEAEWKEILEQHQVWPKSKAAKRADLSGANLSGVKLTGAKLFGATVSGANLSGADLCDTDLGWANLHRATLSGANLRSARLSGAYLSGANLSGANLSGADLHGANLSGANLSDADLSSANLLDAYLPGANLSGADLRGATGLSADQLRSACAASENPTKLPGGFDPPPPCAEKRER